MLTRERILEVLGSACRGVSEEDIDGMIRASAADPEEGAEWLPYYKAASSILVGTLGSLTGAIERRLGEIDHVDAREHLRHVMRSALQDWYREMLLVGIGPSTDPAYVAKVREIAAASIPRSRHTERMG